MAERGFGEDREDRSVSERSEPVKVKKEPDELNQLIYRARLRQLYEQLTKRVEPGMSKTFEVGSDRIEVQRSDEGNTVININNTPVIESKDGIISYPEHDMADNGSFNANINAVLNAYKYERRRIKRETDDRTDNRERRDEADSRARNKDGDESLSYDIEDEDRYADSR